MAHPASNGTYATLRFDRPGSSRIDESCYAQKRFDKLYIERRSQGPLLSAINISAGARFLIQSMTHYITLDFLDSESLLPNSSGSVSYSPGGSLYLLTGYDIALACA